MIRKLLALALLLPSLAWATCPLTDAYSTAVCADSPTHYYRMDAPSGTTETDVGSDGQDATYAGTVTLAQAGALTGAGITDKAALFDGSSGHMTRGGALNGHPNPGSGAGWSVEVWVKGTASGYIVDQNASAGNYEWYLYNNAQAVLVAIIQGNCSTPYAVISTGSLPNGVWSHIVVTTLGAGSNQLTNVKIYVNASLSSTTTSFTGSSICAGVDTLEVGAFASTGFLNSTIDELSIYASQLSQALITAHYNAGTVAASTGTGLPFNVKRDRIPRPWSLAPERPQLALDMPGFLIDRLNKQALRTPGQYASAR